ncbi:MAG TPA: glycosyltransferase family 2 protein [Bacteroidales bacterium]|nr:glycosyltransferase family 2 protein [Bacteroidales bacterium]
MKSFSIVIPVFNIEFENNTEYFRVLISSISRNCRNITVKDKLNEIVIVDDNGDSNLKEAFDVIFTQENLREKLIYIQNAKNEGQAQSRNIGCTFASGEYIHFIDQDDYISDDFYSLIINHLDDIVIGRPHLYLDRLGYEIPYTKATYRKKLKQTEKLRKLWVLLISNFAVSPGQYLIKRSVFNLADGFPVLKSRGSDDYGLLFKLAAKNVNMRYIDNAAFFYRIHSAQNRNNSQLKNSVIEFFNGRSFNNLSLSLLIVKFIRYRTILWKIVSKIVFWYYFENFKSKI